MKKLILSTTGCICWKLKKSMTQTLLGEIKILGSIFEFSIYVRDDPPAAEEVSGVDITPAQNILDKGRENKTMEPHTHKIV